jgi:methylthioribose-1-phosphate isomerase
MNIFNITPVKFEAEKLMFLDQTLLPNKECYIEINTKEDVFNAIYNLQVRGAPAIGIAAAYGIYVSVRDIDTENFELFKENFSEVKKYLNGARPTAVNLAWALTRMEKILVKSSGKTVSEVKKELLAEAEQIRVSDEEACFAIGEYGLSLLKHKMGILTHCNAGTIATAKYGTCLAPIHLGQQRGYNFKVFVDETRPLLQGARLTAWELTKAGVDVTLICDNMASIVMANGWIDAVVVGCDRMAANGDGANKIGTSGVAILAKEYGIPFYMYVPTSTIDLATKTGEEINIELRNGEEIYQMWYKNNMAPDGVKTYNPAFDVTKAKYITAIITEKGIIYPPYEINLKNL